MRKSACTKRLWQSFKKAETSEESTEALAALACGYASSGRTGEAQSLLAKLRELSARKYVSPYNMALIHLSLDEKDKVFEWLDRGL